MRFISGKENKINLKERKARRRNHSHRRGKLSLVGIGPGALEHLTQKAYKAIAESQIIAGYHTYIKLLGKLVSGKEIISSGMTQEIERAKQAITKALEGKRVCVISSGDPGVYGMAGLILELLKHKYLPKLKIEIIPGIMAASSCASLLGAPLANDFAVISLSDLLTPWPNIASRLRLASKADFVIVLYNPKSRSRHKPLEEAYRIMLKYKSPQTPVGIVKNAFRPKQEARIIRLKSLGQLLDTVDMATTIIVGNSHTYISGGFMITPRGYPVN